MTIRWITSHLGTGSSGEACFLSDVSVVDVRDLVDKAGNRPENIKGIIAKGVELLSKGEKTLVCCDYGISRSNAVAAGILASFEKIPFDVAVRRVLESTGEREIKLAPLNEVRIALEADCRPPPSVNGPAVLMTGASGLIGRAVRAHIEPRFTVVAPSREELDLENGSAKLDLFVSQHNVDRIIHLANPRVYTSNIALGKTLSMLRNVLDVCLARDLYLIYPSCWEIYSGYRGYVCVDESVPGCPRGPYGETKYLAELLIEHVSRTNELKGAVLRSSTVYGPDGDRPKFIYNFIDKAKRGETIVTHRYRNGDPALDLLHVEDLASAIAASLQHRFVGILNLGTGTLTCTRVIAEKLKIMLGSSSRVEHVDIDADTACIAMDSRRANVALGWRATVNLESGLQGLLSTIR